MWKNKIKEVNWKQVIIITIIFVIALIIDSKIDAKEKTELKDIKENYVALVEQNELLESKLQDLTNDQIMFEIEQEEKNKAYEVMFDNQDAINTSVNELMEILIGF